MVQRHHAVIVDHKGFVRVTHTARSESTMGLFAKNADILTPGTRKALDACLALPIRDAVAGAPVKHMDETGIRVRGRLVRLHVACTEHRIPNQKSHY